MLQDIFRLLGYAPIKTPITRRLVIYADGNATPIHDCDLETITTLSLIGVACVLPIKAPTTLQIGCYEVSR